MDAIRSPSDLNKIIKKFGELSQQGTLENKSIERGRVMEILHNVINTPRKK